MNGINASNSVLLSILSFVGIALGVYFPVKAGQKWENYIFKQKNCMNDGKPFLPEETNPFTGRMAAGAVSLVILVFILRAANGSGSLMFYFLIPIGMFLLAYITFSFICWASDKEKNKDLYKSMQNTKDY